MSDNLQKKALFYIRFLAPKLWRKQDNQPGGTNRTKKILKMKVLHKYFMNCDFFKYS